VTGVVGFAGSVTASGATTGAASGNPALPGSSVAGSVSEGSVSGAPALSGSVSGSVTASGSVTGSAVKPQPPTPEPEPQGGGFAPRWLVPPQLQKLQARGRIIPRRSRSTGAISGSRSQSGGVVSVQLSDGFVQGLAHIVLPVLIPLRDSVRERQAADDEFLMLVDS